MSTAQQAITTQIARGEQALALQQTSPALARQFPFRGRARRSGSPPAAVRVQGPWLVTLSADISSRQTISGLAVDALKARLIDWRPLRDASPRAAAAWLRLPTGRRPDEHPPGPVLCRD